MSIPQSTNILELFITFIVSGASITLVSYLATYLNPIIANIIWIYPLGMIFTVLFMKFKSKSNKDISNFLISTLLSIFCIQTFVFLTLIIMIYNNNSLPITIFISIIIWIIISAIFYIIFKKINILKLLNKIE